MSFINGAMEIIVLVAIFIIVILAHELGHAIAYRKITGQGVRWSFDLKRRRLGVLADLSLLPQKDKLAIYYWGFLAGLLTLGFFLGIFNMSPFTCSIMVLGYSIGSWRDIYQMFRITVSMRRDRR